MKLTKDIKLHFILVLLLGFGFPAAIWGVGVLFPENSQGFPIYKNDKLVGFENVGQKWESEKYFWGRPSAVEYNAASTGGSNKGTTNKEYIQSVEERIQEFLRKNPDVKRKDIPSEMVTASGSGIDPHISLQGAYIQVARVAKARNMDIQKINNLIKKNIEEPFLGLFGTKKINVLKLNLALDEQK